MDISNDNENSINILGKELQDMTTFNVVTEGILNDIEEYRTEVNTLLDGYQADLLAEAYSVKAKFDTSRKGNEKECRSINDEVQQMQRELSENANDDVKLFMQTKRQMKSISALEARLSALERKMPNIQCTFIPNRELDSVLKSNRNILGSVVHNGKEIDFDDQALTADKMSQTADEYEEESDDARSDDDLDADQAECSGDTAVSHPDIDKCLLFSGKLVSKEDITVKPKSSTAHCNITGIDSLRDGKLVFADSNNKIIAVLDTRNRNILHRVSLETNPFDVAVLPNNQVAVTLPSKETISVYSFNHLSNKLHQVKTISVDGECYGISYKSKKVVVSYLKPPKIEILDLEGNLCKSLCPSEKGRSILDRPYYVTFTDDVRSLNEEHSDVIFISDKYKKTLTKLSMDGDVLFSYTDYIKYEGCTLVPNGVCAAGGGSVLMCCNYNDENRVILVSTDGQKQQYFLTEDRSSSYQPCAICYNEQDKQVFLTFCSDLPLGDDRWNKVCVYDVTTDTIL